MLAAAAAGQCLAIVNAVYECVPRPEIVWVASLRAQGPACRHPSCPAPSRRPAPGPCARRDAPCRSLRAQAARRPQGCSRRSLRRRRRALARERFGRRAGGRAAPAGPGRGSRRPGQPRDLQRRFRANHTRPGRLLTGRRPHGPAAGAAWMGWEARGHAAGAACSAFTAALQAASYTPDHSLPFQPPSRTLGACWRRPAPCWPARRCRRPRCRSWHWP